MIDCHLKDNDLQVISSRVQVEIDGEQPLKGTVVFDCSAVSYVDLTATKCLTALHSDLKKDRRTLLLAGCCAHVIEQLDTCQFFDSFPRESVFPSVLDAVMSLGREKRSAGND